MNRLTTVPETSNREFLETHSRAGRVGLAGGSLGIDKVIRRAQRHQDAEKRWSLWSHALVFQGERADGRHWVLESDLDVHRKIIRLGVQENRIDKYFDEKMYPTLAVLDFGLTAAQTAGVIREGLDMVAGGTRYSIAELLSTLFGLRHPSFRAKRNFLAKDNSVYCSALVQHLFLKNGVDLVPGVEVKRNSPEDLFRSPVPHDTWLLERKDGRGG